MDIEYREAITGTGLMVFDCLKMNASLSADSCAKSYLHQQAFSCMGCAVGRHHAGRAPLPVPRKNYGAYDDETTPLAALIARKCIRCERAEHRLLAGSICIPCYNRQRECVSGKNGKGKFPRIAASRLRWGFALVESDFDLNLGFYPGQPGRAKDAGGLPAVESMGSGNYFLSAVVSDVAELRRMVSHAAPESEILDIEVGPSFLDLHQNP
ncbi:hypothetical protein [Fluviibacter phosphoraccumulans]|jgi:hypothetical protein|uniref:hypothetical protein n=1 Tax=Fluviibacter phosphoraccumulans TaxID=1751046 RepID=UPI00138A16DB|nr:hypothetical protein [Fluviibacter phosphoraccumulans]